MGGVGLAQADQVVVVVVVVVVVRSERFRRVDAVRTSGRRERTGLSRPQEVKQ